MAKPKVAFFEFSDCEGCQLCAIDVTPEELLALIDVVDIVEFREAMSEKSDTYDVAIVEGTINRDSDIPRLKKIRETASILVALGSCAHIAGINALKNFQSKEEYQRAVYADDPTKYETTTAKALHEIVPVDAFIPGCPIDTQEFLRVVKNVVLGKDPGIPDYPVCVECKRNENVCVYEKGIQCLGPVIRAGCDARCPSNGGYCFGCRGVIPEPNINSQQDVMQKYNLTFEQMKDKFKLFLERNKRFFPMPNTVKVDVHHITRVEGHGNIKVDVKNGELKECKLEIVEAPRFFEAMLKGRHYDEAALITSRICGICSVGHQMASLSASEDAFGIKLSKQEKLLRRLMNCGEYFESHVLHVYFLAVPDFAGAKSVFPLVATHKDAVIQALKLKKLGHQIGDMIGGRLIHSMATNVKAMTKVPTPKILHEIIDRLQDAKEELKIGAELLKALPIPEFERETEYISLYKKGEYALLEGNIFSSDTGETSYRSYREMTNEYLCDHSTAKRTKHSRDTFMVGALARFNNSYEWLSDDAKDTAENLGLKAPCHNPYMITAAQFVELVHIADDCIEAAEELLKMNVALEDRTFETMAGTGVGAVEVPRGILYHEYTYDKDGYIEKANCIIPTGQNLQNIEDDMKALVPTILDKSQEDITLQLEMLVRAYDPCISCSTHLLNVEFIHG